MQRFAPEARGEHAAGRERGPGAGARTSRRTARRRAHGAAAVRACPDRAAACRRTRRSAPESPGRRRTPAARAPASRRPAPRSSRRAPDRTGPSPAAVVAIARGLDVGRADRSAGCHRAAPRPRPRASARAARAPAARPHRAWRIAAVDIAVHHRLRAARCRRCACSRRCPAPGARPFSGILQIPVVVERRDHRLETFVFDRLTLANISTNRSPR